MFFKRKWKRQSKCNCNVTEIVGKFYQVNRSVYTNVNSHVVTLMKIKCLNCGKIRDIELESHPFSCHLYDLDEKIEDYIKIIRKDGYVSEREINEKLLSEEITNYGKIGGK